MMNFAVNSMSDELISSVAQHAVGRRVDKGQLSIQIDAENALTHRLQQQAGLFLGIAQLGSANIHLLLKQLPLTF